MGVQIFAPSGGFLETELGVKVPTITSVSRLAKRKISPMTLWIEHSQNSGSASEQPCTQGSGSVGNTERVGEAVFSYPSNVTSTW